MPKAARSLRCRHFLRYPSQFLGSSGCCVLDKCDGGVRVVCVEDALRVRRTRDRVIKAVLPHENIGRKLVLPTFDGEEVEPLPLVVVEDHETISK